MHKTTILEKTRAYVCEELSGEGSGHDWWHVQRVCSTAMEIGKEENADLYIVELAALLHDIADHKFHDGNEEIGPETAGNWLEKNGADKDAISQVTEIIRDISYKGADVETPMKTLEGQIVQDADRLDAMGAIGIARTFAYGGYKGRPLYDPNEKPELHRSFESYKNSQGTVINHFYEKLLLLKDRMNTETGKKLAAQRHRFMELYLEQFFKEWEGRNSCSAKIDLTNG